MKYSRTMMMILCKNSLDSIYRLGNRLKKNCKNLEKLKKMKSLDCIMRKIVKRKWCLSKSKIRQMAGGIVTVLISKSR